MSVKEAQPNECHTTFNLEEFWNEEKTQHMDAATKSFETMKDDFAKLLEACVKAVSEDKKIIFFGNGGSAADAQHLATELTVRFTRDRAPIPALALTTDTSALTAIGNDYGYEHIFSRQIDALGQEGDIAIGISTSGNSENVLNALRAAKMRNLTTIGLTGKDGGQMKDACDILLVIPSDITARIQEMHITLGHMLCGALEQQLGMV